MDQAKVHELVARVYELLGEKLSVSGATLEARVRKAGRQLPRDVRRAAQDLITAERMADDPRLTLQLDPAHVSGAHGQVVRYLERLNPVATRSKSRYSIAAGIAFKVILIVAAAIAVLNWRGLL
jgi:hypothetical protein